ncbi:MAG: hypothetical protein IT176_12145 [Acidobacteria bacterium]|nr:hypothetical protein [Acidobacteriota bacterium]
MKILGCAAVIAALSAPLAMAQNTEWTKKTYLTFSGPVQIPGKTLAPGTYLFRVADLIGSRHVVQILDKDGTHMFATVMTLSQTVENVPPQNVVMFSERPAGAAPAVKTWYYPGERIGNEFVYPHQQAVQIAKATHQTVLSTSDESASNEQMKSAQVSRVGETGQIVDENVEQKTAAANAAPAGSGAAPAAAARQAPASSAPPASVGTSGQAPAPAAAASPARRAELPHTASDLVLLELLSVFLLAGYVGVRVARRSRGL